MYLNIGQSHLEVKNQAMGLDLIDILSEIII